MHLETWLAYALASFVLCVIPGPSVLLITGQALSKGMRSALICISGEILGGACLMALSLLGVGALIATASSFFLIIKWIGVVYLAYLGLRQLLNIDTTVKSEDIKSPNITRSFSAGFFTALFNPKAIIFYLAFLAQFIDPYQSLAQQYLILIVTAMSMAALVLGSYAILAAFIRKSLLRPRAQRGVNYVSGACYLGGSAWMAATR